MYGFIAYLPVTYTFMYGFIAYRSKPRQAKVVGIRLLNCKLPTDIAIGPGEAECVCRCTLLAMAQFEQAWR